MQIKTIGLVAAVIAFFSSRAPGVLSGASTYWLVVCVRSRPFFLLTG
jgi:hypothetical protein